MLIGDSSATEKYLARRQSSLRQPVGTASPDALDLRDHGTLILRDVGKLSPDQQAQLCRWLERQGSTTVISLAPEPLFPLVGMGVFDERLYYRLNMMLMEVADAAGVTHATSELETAAPSR